MTKTELVRRIRRTRSLLGTVAQCVRADDLDRALLLLGGARAVLATVDDDDVENVIEGSTARRWARDMKVLHTPAVEGMLRKEGL